MTKSVGINRRTFIKSASLTAFAGATGTLATGATTAIADSGSKLANGKYDFDTVYDRVNHNTSRWDSPPRRYTGGSFKYGMGVASMDFECAPCITEAITERNKHHSWGYLSTTEPLRNEIVKWNGERHGIDLPNAAITISDGVYAGMIAALRALVGPGGRVLINTPAYSGFYTMNRKARTPTVDSPLQKINGRYEIDWDDLEAKMTPDVRAMIVCNPQNPTGNVWREDELLRIGRLCLEHDIVVLADEIHADFVRPGHKYTPFASLPDQAVVNNSLTFGAISKTFNLAGMKNAYYYSKNPRLLARVGEYHFAELSTLGVVANEAAYRDGADWFTQALAYIDGSHDMVENYIKQNMPTVGYTRNEGTFMTFLDFSKTIESIGANEQYKAFNKNTPEEYFQDWLVYNSGVYLNPGSDYGAGGAGHMRMNIASSRLVLKDVFDALALAVNKV